MKLPEKHAGGEVIFLSQQAQPFSSKLYTYPQRSTNENMFKLLPKFDTTCQVAALKVFTDAYLYL